MRNRLCLACFYARERRSVGWWFAGTAFVLQLLALVFGDDCNRLIAQGVVRIFILYGKDLHRAHRYAVAATIAFIGINRNEIVTGCVFVSVIG